jgi:flavin reductase (DIM6/NTAB) family NADH-FMN oxidoreductase RutF
MALDPGGLREVMRQWATGVTVVTSSHAGVQHGMTVSSFTSVSLEPPLVLVSLELSSRTHRLVSQAGAFAVVILAEDQQAVAERFSGGVPDYEDRFAGFAVEATPAGLPIPAGCLAWLECEVVGQHEAGNHTLFIGKVEAAQSIRQHGPLMYYNRGYRLMAE